MDLCLWVSEGFYLWSLRKYINWRVVWFGELWDCLKECRMDGCLDVSLLFSRTNMQKNKAVKNPQRDFHSKWKRELFSPQSCLCWVGYVELLLVEDMVRLRSPYLLAWRSRKSVSIRKSNPQKSPCVSAHALGPCYFQRHDKHHSDEPSKLSSLAELRRLLHCSFVLQKQHNSSLHMDMSVVCSRFRFSIAKTHFSQPLA